MTSAAFVHRSPVAVLRAASTEDIVKLVRFANSHGLKIPAQGQAHSFLGRAQVDDGVVVDTSARSLAVVE